MATQAELDAAEKADARVRRWVPLGLIALVLAPAPYVMWTWTRAKWPGQRWFDTATAKAKSWSPDAELIALYGNAVDPTGFADVLHRGSWRFEFRSPSLEAQARQTPQAKPVPGAPPPRSTGPACEYAYHVGHGMNGGYMISDQKTYLSDGGCGQSLPEPVHCTIAQVWERAAAKGAPRPGFASIKLETTNTGRVWSFEIPDLSGKPMAEAIFKTSFPDDCK